MDFSLHALAVCECHLLPCAFFLQCGLLSAAIVDAMMLSQNLVMCSTLEEDLVFCSLV